MRCFSFSKRNERETEECRSGGERERGRREGKSEHHYYYYYYYY